MFNDSFVGSAKALRTRAVAFPAALLVHFVAVLALIVGPLLRDGDLPRWNVSQALLVPPPPVPALPAGGRPRPAGRSPRIQPAALGRLANPGRLVAPVQIPDEIREETLADSSGWSPLTGAEGFDNSGPVNGFVDVIIQNVAGDRFDPAPVVAVVRPPRLVKRVSPDYPELARQARVSGSVKVEATTDAYGRVVEARVLESIPLLDRAALDAVRQWVYEPMVINGQPRRVSFAVTVKFVLK